MNPKDQIRLVMTRRQLFGHAARGIGVAALASLLPESVLANTSRTTLARVPGVPGLPHFPPTAKRVIYLFQVGAPSHIDLLDYKPKLARLNNTQTPASVLNQTAAAAGATTQDSYPIVASPFEFAQAGKSGAWVSELLPHTAKVVDDICIIKSLNTDIANHVSAITYLQTGFVQPGRPSMGAWVTYGLGAETQNLPAFAVLVTRGKGTGAAIQLSSQMWGTGFMPSNYQGAEFLSGKDPVLYLSDPPGIDRSLERGALDTLSKLNELGYDSYGDPDIQARIAQYEMAYRMQSSVPELTDLSKEPDSVFKMYGPDSRTPGTYAANCVLARRMAERGVRFIQLYHRNWDHHVGLKHNIRIECQRTDQASAALIQDLKQRGLLEDTLVIWGGEFGRTVYMEGAKNLTAESFGRDHHAKCFTVWMAGGGIKAGISYGETDDFSYNIVKDPVSVHDLQATILHCLGIDHTRLTYKFQGRYFRLTDISGEVVKDILV